MSAAEEFTPGTQVVTGRGPQTRLGVVERTTATQILVRFYAGREPDRYRKADLLRVGREPTWSTHRRLRLATEEDRLEVEWWSVIHLAERVSSGHAEENRRRHASLLQEALESYLARTDPRGENDR